MWLEKQQEILSLGRFTELVAVCRAVSARFMGTRILLEKWGSETND